jgi:hypothetical protein
MLGLVPGSSSVLLSPHSPDFKAALQILLDSTIKAEIRSDM